MGRLETLVLSGLFIASPILLDKVEAFGKSNVHAETSQKEKLKERSLERYIQKHGHENLTDTEIENFYIPMMKQSVYETLDPNECNVKEITPYNFDEIVYGDTKPKLVLFSRNINKHRKPEKSSRGISPVFRALSVDYSDSIDFYVFHIDNYSDAFNNKWADVNAQNLIHRENIKAPPSTAMYTFDLTKEQKGDRIEQVDILRGGPDKSKHYKPWYNGLKNKWINSNMGINEQKEVKRFNNSRKLKSFKY